MLSPDAIANSSAEILETAKALQKAAKKLENMREQKLVDLDRARELQDEAATISQAKLDGEVTAEMRDLTKVHREVLKAHNRVDKAIDKANEAEEELSQRYRELRELLENGAGAAAPEPAEQAPLEEPGITAQSADAEPKATPNPAEGAQEEIAAE